MSVFFMRAGRCCALLLTYALCGCGESRPPLAVAGGRVVCEGIAVTSGSITFVPIPENGQKNPGKAAKGEITGDGTFRLSTWDVFDGAVVGRHRVEFEAAEEDAEETEETGEAAEDGEKEARPARKLASPVESFHLPRELIVEVKSGEDNQFTIELSPGKGQMSEDE
jgi:hypothetical protein